jgi:hypothetical protein
MLNSSPDRQYKSTGLKYKGGAHEMYVTYDIKRETRSGTSSATPRVKRIYISGRVKNWHVGNYVKRTGRKVYGVKIEYTQTQGSYARTPYTAKRGGTSYKVSPAKVSASDSTFTTIVEVPKTARNIHFYSSKLPHKYASTLQRVR